MAAAGDGVSQPSHHRQEQADDEEDDPEDQNNMGEGEGRDKAREDEPEDDPEEDPDEEPEPLLDAPPSSACGLPVIEPPEAGSGRVHVPLGPDVMLVTGIDTAPARHEFTSKQPTFGLPLAPKTRLSA